MLWVGFFYGKRIPRDQISRLVAAVLHHPLRVYVCQRMLTRRVQHMFLCFADILRLFVRVVLLKNKFHFYVMLQF